LLGGLVVNGLCQSREIGMAAYLSELEQEVVQELNLARKNPRKYAAYLEKMKPYYDGKLFKRPGRAIVQTQEGRKAVDEAIHFLRSAKPLAPFRVSPGMSQAARDHVRNQGLQGAIGHKGSDGSEPSDRVNRYGKWIRTVGENIAYGSEDARDIVIGLIVDDGVSDRGHRKNIFNPSFQVIGVACGAHKVYQTMCVITFAGGFSEKRLPR
ncbi:MAG: CAP domain-containing protein, partial [candidate division KSB1 bacterium]|nr:CAP domain-containing protein [candidate division KSB1 bacterium]